MNFNRKASHLLCPNCLTIKMSSPFRIFRHQGKVICQDCHDNLVQKEYMAKKECNNNLAYRNWCNRDNLAHEKVYLDNPTHEKVCRDNLAHENVYQDNLLANKNLAYEKVYQDNLLAHKVYPVNLAYEKVYQDNLLAHKKAYPDNLAHEVYLDNLTRKKVCRDNLVYNESCYDNLAQKECYGNLAQKNEWYNNPSQKCFENLAQKEGYGNLADKNEWHKNPGQKCYDNPAQLGQKECYGTLDQQNEWYNNPAQNNFAQKESYGNLDQKREWYNNPSQKCFENLAQKMTYGNLDQKNEWFNPALKYDYNLAQKDSYGNMSNMMGCNLAQQNCSTQKRHAKGRGERRKSKRTSSSSSRRRPLHQKKKKEDNKTFSIKGPFNKVVEHQCKYSGNGCPTKMGLSDITEHEDNCVFRKITCPKCTKKIVVTKLSSHDVNCWSVTSTEKTSVIENWAEKKDSSFYPVDLIIWDGQEFYIGGVWLEEEKKKWFFYAAMLGSAEERAKYRVHFYLENPKSKEMEYVTVSEVLPIEAISSSQVLLESGAFGSVMYKLLERYVYIDNQDDRMYTLKVELEKYELEKW